MMIFIGLVLLIIYLVGFIKGGWFKEYFVGFNAFEKKVASDEWRLISEEEQLKDSIKFASKALGMLAFSIVASILVLVFFIGALSIDVLLFPTLIMLAYYIYGIVHIFVSKKKREKNQAKDMTVTHTKDQVKRGVMLLYILYILVLLIV